MKAVIFAKYGSPDGLHIEEIPLPVPGDNDVLIRVHATTVTAGDTEIRRLKLPGWLRLPFRLYAGFRRPKRIRVLGMELSGEIVSVGTAVTRFQTGDQIFAATDLGFGAYAEYICMAETGVIAKKPANISYEEAAAVPVGGLEALSLVRKAHIAPGDEVLVYGGSGSIGTFAVQLAGIAGGRVSAVCGPTSLKLIQSLGAGMVFDYTTGDFARDGATYDVIIDAIGKSSFSQCIRKLKAGGRLMLANPRFSQVIRIPWIRIIRGKKVVFGPSDERSLGLHHLKELLKAGKLKTIIDRSYPLEQIAEAHRYVDAGQKIGNVIITIAHDERPKEGE